MYTTARTAAPKLNIEALKNFALWWESREASLRTAVSHSETHAKPNEASNRAA